MGILNLENVKDTNRVRGYIFRGYKTRRELIGELSDQNQSSKKRIMEEENKITEREAEKKALSSSGRLDDMMYGYSDIRSYL